MWRPIAVGVSLADDLRVLGVDPLARGRWAVRVGVPSVTVMVEIPREGCEYLAQASGLGLWVQGTVDAPAKLAVSSLAEHLSPRGVETVSGEGTLYLVPGHLGNPLDLSLRGLERLGRVSAVFVEAGKSQRARDLLEGLGVTPRSVQPIDPRAVREVIEQGGDAALFGVDEGIPGFVDPGLELKDFERVRSVGGASVLGAVLMRAELPAWRFTFLGALHDPAGAIRLRPELAAARHPVILFSSGRGIRALPSAVPGPPRRIRLLIALTRPEERVVDGVSDALPELEDRDHVVVVVYP